MISARTARSALPRAARSVKAPGAARQTRFQTNSSTIHASNAPKSGVSPFVAGLAGGVAAGGLLYGGFLLTPSGKMARSINKATKETQKKYQEAAKKIQETTPDADQTYKYIKDFCYSYVAWIPGGRQYVDVVFKDLETIRKNHREDADRLLSDAYKQLQDVSRTGLNLEAVRKLYDVLIDLSIKVADLSTDALGDVIDNHPQLKEKFGPSIDQLKQLGDEYGPEAKKQVNETWKQVRDVAAGGLTAANLDKARKIIQEKIEQVKKLGDEAWNKGLEQAKPFLDKNPKVKELIEKNADALKQGNAKELFNQAKKAAESGDLGDLEGYVNKAVDKTKSKGKQLGAGLGLEQYFDKIPNGSEILPKLQQLKEVAEKHSGEGEDLLKETLAELKAVLEKKSEKAEKILNKAEEESKK